MILDLMMQLFGAQNRIVQNRALRLFAFFTYRPTELQHMYIKEPNAKNQENRKTLIVNIVCLQCWRESEMGTRMLLCEL